MTQTFAIEGMSCEACVGHVKRALDSLAGVKSATVSLNEKRAVVVYDDTIASVDEMVEAVDEEGYSASPVG